MKVLFEKQDGEYVKGHTTNYLVVKIKAEGLENQIKDVKITSRDGLELIGENVI